MPIRKGRLHRICIRCKKTFEPSSKVSWVCDKCKENNHKKRIIKNRRNKKKK